MDCSSLMAMGIAAFFIVGAILFVRFLEWREEVLYKELHDIICEFEKEGEKLRVLLEGNKL